MHDAQGKRPYGEVLRGVRGGVQDVAVKRLMCSADGKLEKFVEVQLTGLPSCQPNSLIPFASAKRQLRMTVVTCYTTQTCKGSLSHAPSLLTLQEVSMLKGLNYDGNITQFYGACIQPGARPMLISEFMEGVTPEMCLRRCSREDVVAADSAMHASSRPAMPAERVPLTVHLAWQRVPQSYVRGCMTAVMVYTQAATWPQRLSMTKHGSCDGTAAATASRSTSRGGCTSCIPTM